MAIDTNTREEPKKVLQDMEVHDQWIGHFRSAENEPFYDLAFDYIARKFGDPSQALVVDAGCGSATKTLNLAKRGYRVLGLDLSESIIENARTAVAGASGTIFLCCFSSVQLSSSCLYRFSSSRSITSAARVVLW